MTQAAVSRQIKLVETDLNVPLFLRQHRKLVLTPSGQALAATVTAALRGLADMVETLRQPDLPSTVTVSPTLAFNHFWILPRLAGFRAAHPEIKLKLVADDGPTDLRRDRLDVVIRYGKEPFADAPSIASRGDRAFPVCSPELLARLGLETEAADLSRLPLVASDSLNPSWLTWRSWANGVGLGPEIGRAADRSRLRFDHYTDTIQAALNGDGVALGRAMLISAQLRDGRLVRVGRHSLDLEDRYHVLVPTGRDPSAATLVFLDWITGLLAARD